MELVNRPAYTTNVKHRVVNSQRLCLGQVETNLHVGEESVYPTSS
jgi:hypothetical protein